MGKQKLIVVKETIVWIDTKFSRMFSIFSI